MKQLILILTVLVLTSCSNHDKYDGMILTDEKTGKKYVLNHNYATNYFITEPSVIVDGDTTYVNK